jgi:5-methylcytosine-specific restriction endonuclease McrA
MDFERHASRLQQDSVGEFQLARTVQDETVLINRCASESAQRRSSRVRGRIFAYTAATNHRLRCRWGRESVMSLMRPDPPCLCQDPSSSDRLRQAVLRRDGWRCQSCRTMSNLEVHHKQFRRHSGSDTRPISSVSDTKMRGRAIDVVTSAH